MLCASDRAKPREARRWLPVAFALLIAGCHATTDGRPVPLPEPGLGEPSARPTTPAPTATAPDGTIPLPSNADGYVFIETKSGLTRCQLTEGSVGCEAQFTDSPMQDGVHTNGVSITADGVVDWVLGNLGDIPTVTIDYHTYSAVGWTIAAGVEGTRFTNDGTGHGMFVSVEKVDTF